MKKVISLKKGSTIGIYSPSEPIVESRIERFYKGIDQLKNNFFNIKLSPNCLVRSNYMAGDIKQRVSDIHTLLLDNEVDALLSAWGGKSCNQMIMHLNYDLIAAMQKPVIGFSDPCVLLNNITARTGLVTFYGPNVLGKLHETEHSKLEILTTNDHSKNLLGRVEDVENKVIISGDCEGKLIGGNLSTFVLGVACSNIPLSYYDDAILFWEDMGITAQIINQYLTALDNIGILDRLSGMIIGAFIHEEKIEWKQIDYFESLGIILDKFKFPILYAPTFGHANIENPILPIGSYCKLNTGNKTLNLTKNILI